MLASDGEQMHANAKHLRHAIEDPQRVEQDLPAIRVVHALIEVVECEGDSLD